MRTGFKQWLNGLTLLNRMTFASNPYKILGVQASASAQEIKLAYYKLAQQFHPDKNDAKDASRTFAQINEAYELLSEQSKRRTYDQCNPKDSQDYEDQFKENTSTSKNKKRDSRKTREHFKSQARSQDDYQSFFDEFDSFFQQKQGKKRPYYQKIKGQDIKIDVSLNFHESLFGATKSVDISKVQKCKSCQGSRIQTGSEAHKCYTCGGTGSYRYLDDQATQEIKCEQCDGWGVVVKVPCKTCNGNGTQQSLVRETIVIPKDIENGQLLRKQFAGHSSATQGEDGDLVIKLQVQNDACYRKEGHNIISKIDLTISEAVLGTKKIISTIWGDVQIDVPASCKPSSRLNIPQMGVQYGAAEWKKGDHVVVVNLRVPKTIDNETKQLFYQIYKTQS